MSSRTTTRCLAALIAASGLVSGVANAANPKIVGSASPNTLMPGDWVLVTAKVTKGTKPRSTGMVVTANLSQLGRSIAQNLNDSGQYGDAVANDGIWSYRENIASALTNGTKNLSVTVRDAQGRSATGTFTVTVGSTTPTPPPPPPAISLSGSSSATPSSFTAGGSTLLTTRVTAATEPSSTGITVTGNLGGIGGGSSQAFRDDGQGGDAVANDGVYSYSAATASTLAGGSYSLSMTVRDSQGRSATAPVTVQVSAAAPAPSPTSPSGIGSSNPGNGLPGSAVVFSVRVTPGTNPTSSGITVNTDLSALGLSNATALLDNGTNGDAAAGDGIYSARATLPSVLSAGARSLSARVADAQGRSTQSIYSFTVDSVTTPPPPPPTATAQNACTGFYSAGSSLISGKTVTTMPTLPRPAKGQRFVDPDFGTCGVRATDHAAEAPSGFARNDYSRRQAFNADNTRFIVFSQTGHWHMYDANTLAYIKVLPGLAGDAEPQWHPTEASSLYWVPTNGGTRINKLNVETGVNAVAADFAGRLPWSGVSHIWTRSEGGPSADGRYWCLMAENSSFNTLGVFTYDMQTGQVIATKNMSARPDHISMSASGRWCVVSHLSGSGGTVAWDRQFTQSRLLHGTSEHSDLALDANGNDIYIAVDYQANQGDVFMFNIDTNVRTNLFPTYVGGAATAYHFSGKNFSRPGWALVSAYAGYGANQWYMNKLFAVELAPNPRILQIGHHQSRFNGYWTEPHASVNRDFTRVLWTSNWGTTSSTDVDAYMIHLAPHMMQ
jgi:hypothetical protein